MSVYSSVRMWQIENHRTEFYEVISGFRRDVDENCTLLGYYAVISGNFLPTFRDNLSVPSSGVKNTKESLLYQYGVYIGKNVGAEKSQ